MYVGIEPAEGSDPPAQLHVAVRTEVIAADEQLHRVIPLSAGRVHPAGTGQRRVQLQFVKVQRACSDTQRSKPPYHTHTDTHTL